jgi:hypothetical protein
MAESHIEIVTIITRIHEIDKWKGAITLPLSSIGKAVIHGYDHTIIDVCTPLAALSSNTSHLMPL